MEPVLLNQNVPDLVEDTAMRCLRCARAMPGIRRKALVEINAIGPPYGGKKKIIAWVWTEDPQNPPCYCGWKFGDPQNGSIVAHPYLPNEATLNSECRTCGEREAARIHSTWKLDVDSPDPKMVREEKKRLGI